MELYELYYWDGSMGEDLRVIQWEFLTPEYIVFSVRETKL